MIYLLAVIRFYNMDLIHTDNPTEQSILNQAGKDKFLLVLDVPPFLRELNVGGTIVGVKPLQLTVYGSVVPSASVPNVNNGFSGQVQQITSMHRPEFSPLTVNFVVDNRYHNYYIMWKWFDGLNNPLTGAFNVYKNDAKKRGLYDYQANMSIYGLDEYNVPVVKFTYLHAFVTAMGGIEYSYQDQGIINSNVTFQFDQFLMELVPGV